MAHVSKTESYTGMALQYRTQQPAAIARALVSDILQTRGHKGDTEFTRRLAAMAMREAAIVRASFVDKLGEDVLQAALYPQ